MHSIRHLDKFYNHPDALHTIFFPTQTQLSRRSCCVATTPNSSLHKLRKHSTKSSEDHFHHPVTHDFALAASRAATRLCTSSPLGCPVHLHLARYVVLHSTTSHVITIWPPHASPLGWARLHHSTALRVTTRLRASSPLDRSVHCHSVVHIIAPLPPRASPSVGHVFTSTRPTRERLSYSYGQTSYHTL